MEVEETGWRRWWLGRWRGKGAVVAREVVARAEEATLGAGRGDGAVVREVGAALASGAMVEGELKAAAVMAVTAAVYGDGGGVVARAAEGKEAAAAISVVVETAAEARAEARAAAAGGRDGGGGVMVHGGGGGGGGERAAGARVAGAMAVAVVVAAGTVVTAIAGADDGGGGDGGGGDGGGGEGGGARGMGPRLGGIGPYLPVDVVSERTKILRRRRRGFAPPRKCALGRLFHQSTLRIASKGNLTSGQTKRSTELPRVSPAELKRVKEGGVGQRRRARPRLVQIQCWCPRDVGCVV